jgi:molecular chaperone DnaK
MGMPQIEVTFDIDANGIVNVSAKDMATSRQQAMTITGGTALARDEIDRMMKDAESYAEEDRKRREDVETRNQADQLVHQTEKLLKEQGEQMTAEEKSSVESALSELKAALAGDDPAAIRPKMESLITASQAMAARLYQQAAQSQAAGGPTGPDGEDEDVVEAEIIDEGESA